MARVTVEDCVLKIPIDLTRDDGCPAVARIVCWRGATVDRDNDRTRCCPPKSQTKPFLLTNLKLRSSKVCSVISMSMKSSKRKMKICSR